MPFARSVLTGRRQRGDREETERRQRGDRKETQRRGGRTWEWAWFPVRSCTTSDRQWGRRGRPPGGSSHLYPPGKPVPASLQKLWKDKNEVQGTKHIQTPSLKSFELYITFALLLLFRDLLHPPQQTPQICDAVHEGDLLVLVRPGVLQDIPHIHLGGVVLRFRLPSGAEYEGTAWGKESSAGVCNVSWGATQWLLYEEGLVKGGDSHSKTFAGVIYCL